MKFFIKEFFWGLVFLGIGFMLLPLVHVCDWSDVYLNIWVWLKENTMIRSDGLIRKIIIFSSAIVSVLLLTVAGFFVYKSRFFSTGTKIRVTQFGIVCLVLAFLELYLNWQGYFPGSFYRHFKIVRHLTDMTIQYSDSAGIVRYQNASKYLPADYAINKDGFRSKHEFDTASIKSYKTSGKKVLMVVGDSFVAGLSAQPVTNCFADLLENDTIVSLNLGQLGADPLQYELVCSLYVPKLKPDYLIVCVYENDFLTYERKPTPGIPIYYRANSSPNGGMLLAQKPLEFGYQPNDNFSTVEEAYQFYVRHYSLRESKSLSARGCSYSALLTQLYLNYHPPQSGMNIQSVTGNIADTANQVILHKHLSKIREICERERIPVLFAGIPAAASAEEQTNLILGDSLTVYYPVNFSPNDFNTARGDIHFNNQGHLKYAAFLREMISK